MSHFDRGQLVTDWAVRETLGPAPFRYLVRRWRRTAEGWDDDERWVDELEVRALLAANRGSA